MANLVIARVGLVLALPRMHVQFVNAVFHGTKYITTTVRMMHWFSIGQYKRFDAVVECFQGLPS
jgi:hypothetical protein